MRRPGVRALVEWRPTPAFVVGAAITVYVAYFGVLTWIQQSNFGTFGYDMGIYDQGLWLLSRFHNPFMTVRGYPLFGHHATFILVALVPAYWLGGGPHFLTLLQTVWMAAGAVPVYALARARLASAWSAVAIACSLLLYPAFEWVNEWHFHPDALAITPLLIAWWAAHNRRWRVFGLAIFVALTCKEDVALAVAVMGVLVACRYHRRIGTTTALLGAGWFFFCVLLLLPYIDGGATPFYVAYFPELGSSLSDVARNAVIHPSRWLELFADPTRLTYLRQLLLPVALVALTALPELAIAGPQLLVNLTSGGMTGFQAPHTIRYHYGAIVVVGVILATIEGCARRTPAVARRLVLLIVASSLIANVLWAPTPAGSRFAVWRTVPPANSRSLHAALDLIPPGAGVAASTELVPHLTHRRFIYQYPSPWLVERDWAIPLHPQTDRHVDFVVLGSRNVEFPPLLDRLIGPGGEFKVMFERDGVLLARRVR